MLTKKGQNSRSLCNNNAMNDKLLIRGFFFFFFLNGRLISYQFLFFIVFF